MTGRNIRLDKSLFTKVQNIPEEYITIQTIGGTRHHENDGREARNDIKRLGDHKRTTTKDFKKYIDSFGLPTINLNNIQKKYSLPQICYLIDNAKYHVGLDSGSTHLALTIKNKEDVFICVNGNYMFQTTEAWILNNYHIVRF